MKYSSDSIASVIGRLNAQYFLPAIQREFVWRPEQVVQLFDSIMRGYPISSFLFWELKPENRDNWEVYRFIDEAAHAGVHNRPAVSAGVNQLTLVLDGQQRLTSLLVALKGTYTVKKKYKRKDNPSAYEKQSLFLDLLKDPATEEGDEEAGIRYGFRFMKKAPPPDAEHYWFAVGKILAFDSEDRLYEFRSAEREQLPDSTTKRKMTTFEKNLERLYRAVWKDDFIAYYTEHDQDYDRVLDIFVRANEGGTKLSKSDLLLSMITSRWSEARQEIYDFVDRINDDLTRKNDFDKDFVMKTSLVVSDLAVEYKVANFNNKNLDTIRSNWPLIKRSSEAAIELVNRFGLDRSTLTSKNALIPIIYYLSKRRGGSLATSSKEDVRNAASIRRWLTMALLNNLFGGSSDTMLRENRRVVAEALKRSDHFPEAALARSIASMGRKASFDDDAIMGILGITYGDTEAFLALSLLYEERNWGIMEFHIDHIFPRSLFTKKHMEEEGINSETQDRYGQLVNCLGNLEILTSEENLQKSNKPFENWIRSRDKTFYGRHLIPPDEVLLDFKNFERFIKEREKMIWKHLRSLLSTAIEDDGGSE